MADTNLEPFMVADVNELGVVGSNDNLHIRELIDRSAEYGDDELLDQGSWVGARVLDLAEITDAIRPDSSRPVSTSSTCWASTPA